MKFWNRLRWIATIAFMALLVASWLASSGSGSQQGDSPNPVRMAPNFNH